MGRTIKQLRVKVGDYPQSKNIMAEEKNIMTQREIKLFRYRYAGREYADQPRQRMLHI